MTENQKMSSLLVLALRYLNKRWGRFVIKLPIHLAMRHSDVIDAIPNLISVSKIPQLPIILLDKLKSVLPFLCLNNLPLVYSFFYFTFVTIEP